MYDHFGCSLLEQIRPRGTVMMLMYDGLGVIVASLHYVRQRSYGTPGSFSLRLKR